MLTNVVARDVAARFGCETLSSLDRNRRSGAIVGLHAQRRAIFDIAPC
jgi:hypothetical protein